MLAKIVVQLASDAPARFLRDEDAPGEVPHRASIRLASVMSQPC
jgi:hypothetical protein